eukprot:GHVQ01030205.1.p1 GENE.GHVQ01030205.1~~GHVQ01030205.1.p1  ORF type:complete len:124 (+),score=5.64 GHVQ01030205.1:64-435(+)
MVYYYMESSHKVLEHALKCSIQVGSLKRFKDLLWEATMSFNSTYQSEIGEAPFAVMFGKPPDLPGFQSLSTTVSEGHRLSTLQDRLYRRHVAFSEGLADRSKDLQESLKFKPGDFVFVSFRQF